MTHIVYCLLLLAMAVAVAVSLGKRLGRALDLEDEPHEPDDNPFERLKEGEPQSAGLFEFEPFPLELRDYEPTGIPALDALEEADHF